jgi:hypothetical protein
MTKFDAYKKYLAIRQHFTNKKYDYFKYNGNVRANFVKFEQNNTKFCFEKLSKFSDIENFLVSNFIEHGTKVWIGDLVKDSKYKKTYEEWQKRQQSASYMFEREIEKLDDDLDKLIKTSGDFPDLFNKLLDTTIKYDTIVIMNEHLGFLKSWEKKIEDTLIYPEYHHMIIKYKPFVKFDKTITRKIMQQRWL